MAEDSAEHTPKPRVKNINWVEARTRVDAQPGETFCIGVVDQSMRTHIRNGRFSYIEPSLYDVWTEAVDGSRTRAKLYMRRKI